MISTVFLHEIPDWYLCRVLEIITPYKLFRFGLLGIRVGQLIVIYSEGQLKVLNFEQMFC